MSASSLDTDDDLERLLEMISSRNANETACKTCNRKTVDVLLEKQHSGLLPYGTCSGCGKEKYERFDASKAEFVKGQKFTVLSNLIQKRNWEKASQRAALHPKEGFTVTGNYDRSSRGRGEYEERSALYYAVKEGAPFDLVERLARAAPREICRVYYHCYQGWPEYDCMGFQSNYPEQHYDCEYSSPLQLAVSMAEKSDASVEMVKILLRAHLEKWGASHLHYRILATLEQAYKAVQEMISTALSKKQDLPSGNEIFRAIDDNGERCREWKRCWEVLGLLYRAIHFECIDDENQSVLEAIACARTFKECPEDLLRFALKMYPGELEKSNAILHLLAEQTKRPSRPRSLEHADFHPRPSYYEEDDDEYYYEDGIPGVGPFYDFIRTVLDNQSYKPKHLQIVLDACPRAAGLYNQGGMLPLHVAICSGRSWKSGVGALVSAHPQGLKLQERTQLGLVPFQLAATCEDTSLDLVFELLRSCPEACSVGEGNNDGAGHKRNSESLSDAQMKANKKTRTARF